MKCQKLHPNRRGIQRMHYLWCKECRGYREIDALIYKGMDAFRQPNVRVVPDRGRRQTWILATACAALVVLASLTPYLRHRETPKAFVSKTSTTSSDDLPRILPDNKVVSPLKKSSEAAPVVAKLETTHQTYRRKPALPTTEEFLNKDRDLYASHWQVKPVGEMSLATILGRQLPEMKDDFVALPEVVMADASSPEVQRENAELIFAEYQKQAAIVDDRLTKTVTFASPQDSLTEICASLSKQTGVDIRAARNVADDNICLFIKKRPARDVMRSITKLFGYVWVRTEQNGVLEYLLEQDRAGQAAEENIRKEDIAAAFAKIVDANKRSQNTNSLEKAVRKLFGQLTVTEVQTLKSGGEAILSNNPRALRQLDPDISDMIMANFGNVLADGRGGYVLVGTGTRINDIPGALVTVTYSFAVEEFGGATAKANVNITLPSEKGNPTSWNHSVAIATTPGVGEGAPNNTIASADQARMAELDGQIQVSPPEYTAATRDDGSRVKGVIEMVSMVGWKSIARGLPPPVFTSQGELWAAIESASHFDVVADSFSRLVFARQRSGKALEVLNGYGDSSRFRWRFDDGIVYARSTTFAWERLNEVPKNLILRWKKLCQNGGHLPIKEIVNMSQLSDRQLDSWSAGQRIYHREGIHEWGIIARPWLSGYLPNLMANRQLGRSLVNLPAGILENMAKSPVALSRIPPDVANTLFATYGPWTPEPAYVALDFVPTDSVFWNPSPPLRLGEYLGLFAKSNEDLTEILRGRKIDEKQGQFVKTDGHLSLLFFSNEGKLIRRVGDQSQIATIY